MGVEDEPDAEPELELEPEPEPAVGEVPPVLGAVPPVLGRVPVEAGFLEASSSAAAPVAGGLAVSTGAAAVWTTVTVTVAGAAKVVLVATGCGAAGRSSSAAATATRPTPITAAMMMAVLLLLAAGYSMPRASSAGETEGPPKGEPPSGDAPRGDTPSGITAAGATGADTASLLAAASFRAFRSISPESSPPRAGGGIDAVAIGDEVDDEEVRALSEKSTEDSLRAPVVAAADGTAGSCASWGALVVTSSSLPAAAIPPNKSPAPCAGAAAGAA